MESNLKILSVVPSITELLFDLGLGKQVVGRTKFCVHPKGEVKKLPIIGGTKNLHIEKIRALRPDFIIANKEENTKEDIEALAKETEIWLTEISTLEENFKLIEDLSDRFGISEEGRKIIEKTYATIHRMTLPEQKSALYLIWRNPYMSVGKDTFIHHMLKATGYTNICADLTRYPIVDLQQFKQSPPDCVLLSSEPYPFRQKHIAEISRFFPESEIKLVNGEFFSWYGSRIANL